MSQLARSRDTGVSRLGRGRVTALPGHAAARLAAWAAAGRQIMERTGALFAVAQQAAAVEPLIAGHWQEGREQTQHAREVFWTRLAEDGLLPHGADLAWLIDTARPSMKRALAPGGTRALVMYGG